MLTTLIAPTSGTARVAGHDVTTEPRQVRRRIGYIGQGNGAGHQQRGRDELVSHGRAYGLDRATARRRAAELVESLDLGEVADRKVSSLSGGQRRRLDIAMGLIHGPDLLFLDEPSTGLDPQNRANLQEHIVALRAPLRYDGRAHHALPRRGRLARRAGRRHRPRRGHRRRHARPAQGGARRRPDAARPRLRRRTRSVAAARIGSAHPEARVVLDGRQVAVEMTGATVALPPLCTTCTRPAYAVRSAEVTRPTLDDVFLTLTGRSLREGHSGTPPTSRARDQTEEVCRMSTATLTRETSLVLQPRAASPCCATRSRSSSR